MEAVFKITNLTARYGPVIALREVSIAIPRHGITAVIGASGCGKSTFLRCLNRMNDLKSDFRLTGTVHYNGENIYAPHVDVIEVRKQIGMVFQKPNVFPKTVYENVAYGLRIHGERRKRVLDQVVEHSLRQAALWDEVHSRLHESALHLSGGQQQRLCIARALAVEPQVILFDEPCSALDPLSTRKIEELIVDLKQRYDIVVVTHNMQQARRISDYVGFFHLGELKEFGPTVQIFEHAEQKITHDYVHGIFG